MTSKRSRMPGSALAVALAFTAAAVGAVVPATVAFAQSAAKAVVDAAKAAGQVGEQGDGFLGMVKGSVPPDVAAAMAEINAGRAAVYRDTAARTGVTPDAAGQATALKLIAKVPAGQYYKPLGGSWTRN